VWRHFSWVLAPQWDPQLCLSDTGSLEGYRLHRKTQLPNPETVNKHSCAHQDFSAVMVWGAISKKRASSAGFYRRRILKKRRFWINICCQQPGTRMETTIFASSKTEPNLKQQNSSKSGLKKICQISSPRISFNQLTGLESSGFL
jgi:hypothetical protein